MKKALALLLTSVCSVGLLAGCTQTESDQENTAPVISGVRDTASTVAGTQFDALEGVTASDAEDGDLTSSVTVESVPAMTFTDGVATPPSAGSYELIYSVIDSDGAEGNAYCTLTVSRAASAAEVLYSFDFSDVTPAESDKRGWTANISGGVDGTAALKEGAYVFDIAALNGQGDGSVTLSKVLGDLGAGDYRIVVWARATADTYVHLLAEDASTDDWKTVGGGYNLKVGTSVSELSTTFTLDDTTTDTVDVRIHMGKITPNPENPSDTPPDAFSIYIEKIALYCTTGTETRVDLYEEDFWQSADSVTTQAGDGAAASVSLVDGVAQIAISSYHGEGVGGIWSLKADIALGGAAIDAGAKYGYSVELSAQNAQAGELLVENKGASSRANFASFSLNAGEKQTFTGVFTAEATIAANDAVLRLQIGNASEGVTSNTLTVDNVVLYRLDGDKRTDRVLQDRFLLFGSASSNETNSETPYEVFNGSDDNPDQAGIGTMFTQNGSLIYRIEEAGEADWHNKLVIGYTANPLVLQGSAYYTFRIRMKASAPITFNFYVHDLKAFDWDTGLIVRQEAVSVGTEETTIEYTTTTPTMGTSDYEMLFQFGSQALAALGEVVIEISEITVLQSVLI